MRQSFKKKKQPEVIISTTVGSFTKYLYNAPFGRDNKRHPTYTPAIDNAKRFYDDAEAKAFIGRFAFDKDKEFLIARVAEHSQQSTQPA